MSKQVQCILVALATSLLGSGIITIVTVAKWLSPITPALILIGTALIPAVLAGLLVIAPADQRSWTRQLLYTGAMPGAVFGCVAIIVSLTWALPPLRATVANILPATFQGAKPLLAALDDTSNDVAIAACKNLAENNFAQVYTNAITSIVERPKVAVPCFKDAKPDHNRTVLQLSESWHQTLLSYNHDPQLACELSDALNSIAPNNPNNLAQLTNCALIAPSPHAHQCCTQTLQTYHSPTQEIAEKLKHSHETLAHYGLTPELISASFSGSPTLGTTSLKTPQFQRLALLTACDNLQHSPQKTLSSLYHLAQTLECLEPTENPSTNFATWARICRNMKPQLVAQIHEKPQETFCKMIVWDNQQQASMLQATSPENLKTMAQIAADIERGASQNKAQELQNILNDWGYHNEANHMEGTTSQNLAQFQAHIQKHFDKTTLSKLSTKLPQAKGINDIQETLAKSDKELARMLNSLEKKNDLTKKQREAIIKFKENIENNPNLFERQSP